MIDQSVDLIELGVWIFRSIAMALFAVVLWIAKRTIAQLDSLETLVFALETRVKLLEEKDKWRERLKRGHGRRSTDYDAEEET